MLLLKPGVRIVGIRPEVVLAVLAAERVFEEAGYDLTLTSCLEGVHGRASLHFSGCAVDLRTRGISTDDLPKLVARLRECLGEDFDVVLETTHIHAEYQPKQPLTNA